MLCDDCLAACCRVYDCVEVNEADVKNLSLATGLPLPVLYQQYLMEEFLYQGLKIKPCPFLQDNRCSVYERRPQLCRTFTPGHPKCQEARAMLLDGKPRGFTNC